MACGLETHVGDWPTPCVCGVYLLAMKNSRRVNAKVEMRKKQKLVQEKDDFSTS